MIWWLECVLCTWMTLSVYTPPTCYVCMTQKCLLRAVVVYPWYFCAGNHALWKFMWVCVQFTLMLALMWCFLYDSASQPFDQMLSSCLIISFVYRKLQHKWHINYNDMTQSRAQKNTYWSFHIRKLPLANTHSPQLCVSQYIQIIITFILWEPSLYSNIHIFINQSSIHLRHKQMCVMQTTGIDCMLFGKAKS